MQAAEKSSWVMMDPIQLAAVVHTAVMDMHFRTKEEELEAQDVFERYVFEHCDNLCKAKYDLSDDHLEEKEPNWDMLNTLVCINK